MKPGQCIILSRRNKRTLDLPLEYSRATVRGLGLLHFIPKLTLGDHDDVEDKDKDVIWTIENADKDAEEDINKGSFINDHREEKEEKEENTDIHTERKYTFYIKINVDIFGSAHAKTPIHSSYVSAGLHVYGFDRKRRFIAYTDTNSDIYIKFFGGRNGDKYVSVRDRYFYLSIRPSSNEHKTPWHFKKVQDKEGDKESQNDNANKENIENKKDIEEGAGQKK